MIITVLVCIFCLLLVDFAIIGFLPSKLKIWPSLSHFVKGDILIEDTVNFTIQTDIDSKYVESMINNKIGYKSLLLTPQYLIVRNTRLTLLLSVEIVCIKRVTTKPALLGTQIHLELELGNQPRHLTYTTKRGRDWITAFSSLGIASEGK